MSDTAINPAIDMVNHPPHYANGPVLRIKLKSDMKAGEILEYRVECIEIMRHIKESRLSNAFKYIWRVALGGSKGNDKQDIDKARFYCQDYVNHEV